MVTVEEAAIGVDVVPVVAVLQEDSPAAAVVTEAVADAATER